MSSLLFQPYKAVVVVVKDMEGLSELVLLFPRIHLPAHHHQELVEVHRAAVISIQLADHLLHVLWPGDLAEGPDDLLQLLDGDHTVAVLVKYLEGRLEFFYLFLGQMFRHGCCL